MYCLKLDIPCKTEIFFQANYVYKTFIIYQIQIIRRLLIYLFWVRLTLIMIYSLWTCSCNEYNSNTARVMWNNNQSMTNQTTLFVPQHYHVYSTFYAGGLLVSYGIINPVVSVSAQTWFCYYNLQLLNNVVIIKYNALLPRA